MPPDDSAEIQLEKGTRTISLVTAGRIQSAATVFLQKKKDQIAEAIPDPIRTLLPKFVGEPSVDEGGRMRLGSWLLEGRDESLVLTHRPLPPGTYLFLLYLDENKGDWQVERIAFERVLPRR